MSASSFITAGGTIVSTIITGVFAKETASKQRDLEEQLAKLDLAQQKELQEHLQKKMQNYFIKIKLNKLN